MKQHTSFLLIVFSVGIFTVSAQTDNSKANESIENISVQISKISKSLEELNNKLTTFSQTFTSNQGLRLSEKQQKLLFAFEVLNRGEARLSTLQILKVQLAERGVTTKRRIALIDENLKDEVMTGH